MADGLQKWHQGYHGTDYHSIEGILRTGVLCKAGDMVIGNKVISIPAEHIQKPFPRTNLYTGEKETFNPHQVFMSPSIGYASYGEVYAKTHR